MPVRLESDELPVRLEFDEMPVRLGFDELPVRREPMSLKTPIPSRLPLFH